MSARRRVLVVTSTYAPAMIADMQRARMLAWELPALGWDVDILCPDERFQLGETIEPDSAPFFAPDTTVHRVAPMAERAFNRLRIGSIGWRAWLPMLRAGSALMARDRFDVVFASTTQFNLFLLAWWWRRSRGTPYVLDFHDPCYKPDLAGGAGWKRRMNGWLHKFIERVSVRNASGLVSVSGGYLRTLDERHGPRPVQAVIPFAGSLRDLQQVQPANTTSGDAVRIVYVGAGAPVMARAFDIFCTALDQLRRTGTDALSDLRIELYGTKSRWQPGQPCLLQEIAERRGVGDLVSERPQRVSYRRSLQLLAGSAGALVLGVDDPDYMPSKLFTYALSGKPLLGILRRESAAAGCFTEIAGFGELLAFDTASRPQTPDNAGAVRRFLAAARARANTARDEVETRHGAAAMAAAHARLFEACVSP